jgi:hypothetical protein
MERIVVFQFWMQKIEKDIDQLLAETYASVLRILCSIEQMPNNHPGLPKARQGQIWA